MLCSAGELNEDEVEKVKAAIASPSTVGIPDWFVNRQRDRKDGKSYQVVANVLDTKFRDDIERMKKIRLRFSSPLYPLSFLKLSVSSMSVFSSLHKGLRHYWNLKVRGQHTCTTGRKGAKGEGSGDGKKAKKG